MNYPLIVYVLEATSGGAKRHVVDALLGLSRRNWPCILYYATQRADQQFDLELRELQSNGVKAFALDMRRNPLHSANYRAIRTVARNLYSLGHVKSAGVIIHGHSSIGGLIARLTHRILIARGISSSCLYTPHAPITMVPYLNPIVRMAYRFIERNLGRWTKCIIAVGQDEFQHIRAQFARRGQLELCPNGINQPIISLPKPERNGLLWVGRLSPQKQPLLALELLKKISGIQLTLVGDGELYNAVVQKTEFLHLSQQVKIMGHMANPLPLYYNAQAFLITSSFEGMPYTILEAMASGCAIIGLRAPGVTDWLANGNFEIQDISTLNPPDLLHWLRDKAPMVGRSNQVIAAQRHSLTSMIHNIENLYLRKRPKCPQVDVH